MSVLLDKLIAKKEYWTQIGFTYGQMIIDFVYMYENNLDIYFDRDNPRVCSYKKQLIELLGSDSEQLFLWCIVRQKSLLVVVNMTIYCIQN